VFTRESRVLKSAQVLKNQASLPRKGGSNLHTPSAGTKGSFSY